jgi:hypothetical protein
MHGPIDIFTVGILDRPAILRRTFPKASLSDFVRIDDLDDWHRPPVPPVGYDRS